MSADLRGGGWPTAIPRAELPPDAEERTRRIQAATEFYRKSFSQQTGPGYPPEARTPSAVFSLVTAECQARFGLTVKDVLAARCTAYREWARRQPRKVRRAALRAADAVQLAVDPPDHFVSRGSSAGVAVLVGQTAFAVAQVWVVVQYGWVAGIFSFLSVFLGAFIVAGAVILWQERPK